MPVTPAAIGAALKSRRESLRMDIDSIAARAAVPRQRVSDLELGNSGPLTAFVAVCEALLVAPAEVLREAQRRGGADVALEALRVAGQDLIDAIGAYGEAARQVRSESDHAVDETSRKRLDHRLRASITEVRDELRAWPDEWSDVETPES